MKILVIIPHFWPKLAGAEVFAKKTTEFIIKKGNQINLLTGKWEKNWPTREKINGVNIIRVKPWLNLRYLKTFGIFFTLYFKSLQLTKETKYDLIHCHIFPANIVGGFLKTKRDISLLTTVQGGDIGDYKENFGPWPQIFKPLIASALKKADMVHVVSKDLKKKVEKLGIKKIKLIPNATDYNLFKKRNKKKLRKKFRIPQNKFVIISNSRLTPKNGLDLLIKSIAKSKNKDQILLLLIGEGFFKKELQKLINRLDICNQVKFLGYQKQEKIAQYLSLSDLFCRPSRQEGFGIAFLEAMSTGIPVVGTKVGGINDFIENNKQGFLVKPENINSLVKTISKLKNNPSLREKIGKAARKRVLQNYTWQKISPRVEKMYKDLKK